MRDRTTLTRLADGIPEQAAHMITAELLSSSCSIDELRTAWVKLYESGDHEPSVSFEWTQALLQNHLAGSSDWFIVVLRRDSAIVGIAPMMVVKERVFGQEVVTLQPIHELYKTHGDVLLSKHDGELIGAWLDALKRLDRRWELIRMSGLLEHSPLRRNLEAELRARGLQYRLRIEDPSFHLALPKSYPEYLAQRSGKFRSYLKRAEKKLEALGKLEFVRTQSPHDLTLHYADLLAIERDSWKHAHGTAISAISLQSGFYRDLCETAQRSGMLHLSFLRLQEKPIAYNLGWLVGGRYFYLKTSYCEEHRASGAATVGRAKLIEALIAEGVQEFDFPGEPYEWELQWTKDMRQHESLLCYNETLLGRSIALVNSIRDLVRKQTKPRTVAFRNPRDLRPTDS